MNSDTSSIPGESDQTSDDVLGGPVEQTEAAAKRVFDAGVGVFALTCDTVAQTFDRLADRGERVRERLETKTDEVREQNRDVGTRFRYYFRNAMDAVLETIDVPSKTDVDAIQAKLNVLNRKLDDLQMQSGREPFVPPEQSTGPPPDLTT